MSESENGEGVEVKFGADAEPLNKGLDKATRSLSDAIARIRSALTGMGDHARTATSKVNEGFKKAEEGVKASTGNITSVVDAVTKRFIAFGAALAAGAMFKGFINDTVSATKEQLSFARTLAISASEASVLAVALNDVYLSTDDMANASVGLQRSLRTNEASMNSLGVKTRDGSGRFLELNTVMQNALRVLGSYKEGIDRNGVALELFGRGGMEAVKLLKLTPEVMEAARRKAEELGLTLTVEGKEAFDKYRASMNDVGDVLHAVRKVVAEAVMPVLAKLGDWFSAIGPYAVTTIKVAIGGLVAAFWYLKNGVTVVWEVINAFVVSIAEPLRAVGAAFYKLLTGDFSGAKEELTSIPKKIVGAWDRAFIEIADSAEETNRRVAALFGKGTALPAPKRDGKTYGGRKEDGDIAAKLEATLALIKSNVAQENAINRQGQVIDAQYEADFWSASLKRTDLGVKDRQAIIKKAADAKLRTLQEGFASELVQYRREEVEAGNNAQTKLDIAEREARTVAGWYGVNSKQYEAAEMKRLQATKAVEEQIRALKKIGSDSGTADALAQIDMESEIAKGEVDARRMTQEQLIALEQQLEDRRYQIRLNALRDAQALIDPQKDPVQAAQVNAQLEEVEREHQRRMLTLRNDAAKEQRKYSDMMFSGMESGFANVLRNFATGTMTIKKLFRDMGKALLDTMVGVFAQIAARWLATIIMEKVIGRAANLTTVLGHAAEAGAAAFAATAAIPIIGPFMAPAAGAAAYAGAASFAAAIPAAKQGWDIPAGLNPITQLHEREMVLPEAQADAVRDMASGGGGPVHIHGTPDDTVKISQLATMLRKMGRDFVFV